MSDQENKKKAFCDEQEDSMEMTESFFVADTCEDDESFMIPPTPVLIPSTPPRELLLQNKRNVENNGSSIWELDETIVEDSILKPKLMDGLSPGNPTCDVSQNEMEANANDSDEDLTQDLPGLQSTQPIIPGSNIGNSVEIIEDIPNTEQDDWELKFSESQETQELLSIARERLSFYDKMEAVMEEDVIEDEKEMSVEKEVNEEEKETIVKKEVNEEDKEMIAEKEVIEEEKEAALEKEKADVLEKEVILEDKKNDSVNIETDVVVLSPDVSHEYPVKSTEIEKCKPDSTVDCIDLEDFSITEQPSYLSFKKELTQNWTEQHSTPDAVITEKAVPTINLEDTPDLCLPCKRSFTEKGTLSKR